MYFLVLVLSPLYRLHSLVLDSCSLHYLTKYNNICSCLIKTVDKVDLSCDRNITSTVDSNEFSGSLKNAEGPFTVCMVDMVCNAFV